MNRPRPVLTKAGIAGGITAIAGVLTFLGYASTAAKLGAEAQSIGGVGIAVVLILSHVLPALSAQKDVTPKDSPQADDGMPLVRADQLVAPPMPPSPAPTANAAVPGLDPESVLAAADALYPIAPPAVEVPAPDPA